MYRKVNKHILTFDNSLNLEKLRRQLKDQDVSPKDASLPMPSKLNRMVFKTE